MRGSQRAFDQARHGVAAACAVSQRQSISTDLRRLRSGGAAMRYPPGKRAVGSPSRSSCPDCRYGHTVGLAPMATPNPRDAVSYTACINSNRVTGPRGSALPVAVAHHCHKSLGAVIASSGCSPKPLASTCLAICGEATGVAATSSSGVCTKPVRSISEKQIAMSASPRRTAPAPRSVLRLRSISGCAARSCSSRGISHPTANECDSDTATARCPRSPIASAARRNSR